MKTWLFSALDVEGLHDKAWRRSTLWGGTLTADHYTSFDWAMHCVAYDGVLRAAHTCLA